MRPVDVYFGYENELDFQIKLVKLQLTACEEPGYEIVQSGAEQPEIDVIGLLSWLNSPELFSRKALFLLNVDKLRVHDKKELIDFIENMIRDIHVAADEGEPYPQRILVMSFERSLPPDFKVLLDKAGADGLAAVHKVEDITRSEIEFIRNIAGQAGKQISAEAVHMLLLSVHADPLMLKNEVFKLLSYIGDRREIDVSDIRLIGSKSAELSAFDFQDMLNKKNLDNAISWIGSRVEGKQEGELISLIFLLYSNYRKMLEVKSMLKAGRNLDQLVKELGISPTRARILASESKNYAEKELAAILEMLILGQYRNRTRGIPLTDCLKDIVLFRCKGIRGQEL